MFFYKSKSKVKNVLSIFTRKKNEEIVALELLWKSISVKFVWSLSAKVKLFVKLFTHVKSDNSHVLVHVNIIPTKVNYLKLSPKTWLFSYFFGWIILCIWFNRFNVVLLFLPSTELLFIHYKKKTFLARFISLFSILI